MRWFDAARETADAMIERFADPERGGFFTTSNDHEQLVARRKDVDDHPIPSGNSAAAYGLLRLAALTGERRYAELAESVFALLGHVAESHPQAVAAPAPRDRFQHLTRCREVALVSSAADGDGPRGPRRHGALAPAPAPGARRRRARAASARS